MCLCFCCISFASKYVLICTSTIVLPNKQNQSTELKPFVATTTTVYSGTTNIIFAMTQIREKCLENEEDHLYDLCSRYEDHIDGLLHFQDTFLVSVSSRR